MAELSEFAKAVMQLKRAKTAVSKAEEQFSIIGADASVIGTLEMISKVLEDLNDNVMKTRYEEQKKTACDEFSDTVSFELLRQHVKLSFQNT